MTKPYDISVQSTATCGWRVEISRYKGENPFVIIVASEQAANAIARNYAEGSAADIDRPIRTPALEP